MIAFLGWAMVVAGLGVLVSTLVNLQDRGFDLNIGDDLTALSPGFTVVAVGATAAGAGHILTALLRR